MIFTVLSRVFRRFLSLKNGKAGYLIISNFYNVCAAPRGREASPRSQPMASASSRTLSGRAPRDVASRGTWSSPPSSWSFCDRAVDILPPQKIIPRQDKMGLPQPNRDNEHGRWEEAAMMRETALCRVPRGRRGLLARRSHCSFPGVIPDRSFTL